MFNKGRFLLLVAKDLEKFRRCLFAIRNKSSYGYNAFIYCVILDMDCYRAHKDAPLLFNLVRVKQHYLTYIEILSLSWSLSYIVKGSR
jgi:hypothetical protein